MRQEARAHELTRFREKLGVPAVFGGIMSTDGNLKLDVVGVRRRGHPEAVATNDRIHIVSASR